MREANNARDIKYVLINAASIGSIDSTGLHKLGLLLNALDGMNVKLLLAGVRGEVRDALFKSGLQDRIGSENCYLTIHDALIASQSSEGHGDLSRKYAAQHNVNDLKKGNSASGPGKN